MTGDRIAKVGGVWVDGAITPHRAAKLRSAARKSLNAYRVARAAFLTASRVWKQGTPGNRGAAWAVRDAAFEAAYDARRWWQFDADRVAAIDPTLIVKGSAMSPNAWARHQARHGSA